MEATMPQIERKIWNADRGSFTATGEAKDVDIDTLEPPTERLQRCVSVATSQGQRDAADVGATRRAG
jgi:hypothetical protein